MENADLTQRVRETVRAFSDERLQVVLSAQEGEYTPEALDEAAKEVLRRGGLAALECRAQESSARQAERLGPSLERADDMRDLGDRVGVGVGLTFVLHLLCVTGCTALSGRAGDSMALGLGIAQFFYLFPAWLAAEASGFKRVAKGLRIGGLVTLLLWGTACAAMWVGFSRNLN